MSMMKIIFFELFSWIEVIEKFEFYMQTDSKDFTALKGDFFIIIRNLVSYAN